jgi:serine protease
MIKHFPTLATLCATLLTPMLLQAPLAQAATVAAPAEAVGRVIVKYKSSVRAQAQSATSGPAASMPQRAGALSQRFGIAMTDGRPIGDRTQVVFAKGMTSAELAARLATDGEVEYAEPDQRRRIRALPNDPLYPGGQQTPYPVVGQWYLRAPDSTARSAIDAESAWLVTKGTSSMVLAILDTGVRFDHPDLAGRLYPGYDFVASSAAANDGDGVDPDASDPGDWLTQSEVNANPEFTGCDGAVADSSWHGTEVAGMVGAATNNNRGIASVAPNVMILPVRVLGKCGGFDSDIIAGMRWAAGLSANPVANPHPARVLNLSLGAEGACSNSYRDVFNQLTANGVVVVVSAGNATGLATDSPANCPGAIAVAGLRQLGTKVGYSNLGPEITLSAPAGNCINLGANDPCEFTLVTTRNLGATSPQTNGYSTKDIPTLGTSFSAPLVAATSALMLSVAPGLTPASVRQILRDSATAFPSTGAAPGTPTCQAPGFGTQDECYCTTTTCGAGMLNAGAALRLAAPPTSPYVPVGSSTANASVDQPINLDALDSSVAQGGFGSYAWSIVSGNAVFVGRTDQDTATVVPKANGYVTVRLTVADSVNRSQTTADTTVLVGPPVVLSASPNTDSGGGGALGAGWLALLGAAVLALRRSHRRT